MGDEFTASREPLVASKGQPVATFVAPQVIKMSMSQMTTFNWSLPEEVVRYRQWGFDGIGVWRPKLVEYGEQNSIDLLRRSELKVTSVSYAGGFTGANGYSFWDAVEEGWDAIRLAADLNADCLVVVSGPRRLHTRRHARRVLYEALCRLGDVAAEEQIDLAVQPMDPMFGSQWSFLNSLDETLSILDRCNHPNVRMAFDIFHQYREPDLLERIPELVPVIATVQLSDWKSPRRCETDRCLLGEGDVPLANIIQTFVDAGYDGYFDVKILSEDLWNSDYAATLHDCRLRCDSLMCL